MSVKYFQTTECANMRESARQQLFLRFAVNNKHSYQAPSLIDKL